MAELGRGGMGGVYLARRDGYRGFERWVALKCVHPHLARDRRVAEAFIDEARIAARITHPFVCRVFDFGEEDRTPYIAMEPLSGHTLRRIRAALDARPELCRSERWPLIATRVIANLCEGLHAAHEACDEQGAELRVVHRDVTPDNLYLLYDGTVRVIDFGIASAKRRSQSTTAGVVKGKLGYIAPEHLLRKPSDRRADVWSMAVVLWELLCGRRLFHGRSAVDVVSASLNAPIEPPSRLAPRVPAALDAVVLRGLSRDPEARQTSMRELSLDLERVLGRAGDPVPAADLHRFLTDLFPGGVDRLSRLRTALSKSRCETPEPDTIDWQTPLPHAVTPVPEASRAPSLAPMPIVIEMPAPPSSRAPARTHTGTSTLPSFSTPALALASEQALAPSRVRRAALLVAVLVILIVLGGLGARAARGAPAAQSPAAAPPEMSLQQRNDTK